VEWFRAIGESVTIVIGAIFILCVLAFRKGIVGELIAFAERRERRESAAHGRLDAAASGQQ
jgi:branched-chain amino acid transport system permease protein